jgi:protein-S-isoprenylcysteine O-methyltransferase Ste14
MMPLRDLAVRYGNLLFSYRNYIFPLVLTVIVAVTTPGTAVSGAVFTLLGIIVTLVGQAVRAAVIGLDYIKRGGINKKVAADHLVMTGIFAHCRNPLYVGNLLILCGLLIVYGNFLAGLIGLMFFYLSYSAIILAEEGFLAGKFGGEYQDYCARVPRWWFKLPGLYATLTGSRFNWRRVVAKDYTTMTTWMICLVLLLAVREVHVHARDTMLATAVISAVVISVILACAYCIKRLKKSGYFAGH